MWLPVKRLAAIITLMAKSNLSLILMEQWNTTLLENWENFQFNLYFSGLRGCTASVWFASKHITSKAHHPHHMTFGYDLPLGTWEPGPADHSIHKCSRAPWLRFSHWLVWLTRLITAHHNNYVCRNCVPTIEPSLHYRHQVGLEKEKEDWLHNISCNA